MSAAKDPLHPYRSGSTEPWAVSVLQALIRIKRPRHILELGTYLGMTTRAMVEVAPGSVTTVDHERQWRAPIGAEFVCMDALEFLEAADPLDFDFVFVDDDHTYNHVVREVELLKKLLPSGSLIVLHDVIGGFGLGQIIDDHEGFIIELPLLHAAGGLGVIEV